jgi:three-Cys-motif partner protein
MTHGSLPDNYIGREQAYIKHRILKTYIERLFMIVGRNKAPVINFVDCFSGPWQEGDEKLSDTSIGISLEHMNRCRGILKHKHKSDVTFRALFIEEDPDAFAKLDRFLKEDHYPHIETACINSDFSEVTDEIIDWCGGHFSFLFLDPKGWDVGLSKIRPLLEMKNCELLINLMYDFLNRFVTAQGQAEKMLDIFGAIPEFENTDPEQRHQTLVNLYRNNLNGVYNGRTAYVDIEDPGKDRVLYNLIYLTRHSLGINVFKTEAEKLNIVQRVTQLETKLRMQQAESGVTDLFGYDKTFALETITDNRESKKTSIGCTNKWSNQNRQRPLG